MDSKTPTDEDTSNSIRGERKSKKNEASISEGISVSLPIFDLKKNKSIFIFSCYYHFIIKIVYFLMKNI